MPIRITNACNAIKEKTRSPALMESEHLYRVWAPRPHVLPKPMDGWCLLSRVLLLPLLFRVLEIRVSSSEMRRLWSCSSLELPTPISENGAHVLLCPWCIGRLLWPSVRRAITADRNSSIGPLLLLPSILSVPSYLVVEASHTMPLFPPRTVSWRCFRDKAKSSSISEYRN